MFSALFGRRGSATNPPRRGSIFGETAPGHNESYQHVLPPVDKTPSGLSDCTEWLDDVMKDLTGDGCVVTRSRRISKPPATITIAELGGAAVVLPGQTVASAKDQIRNLNRECKTLSEKLAAEAKELMTSQPSEEQIASLRKIYAQLKFQIQQQLHYTHCALHTQLNAIDAVQKVGPTRDAVTLPAQLIQSTQLQACRVKLGLLQLGLEQVQWLNNVRKNAVPERPGMNRVPSWSGRVVIEEEIDTCSLESDQQSSGRKRRASRITSLESDDGKTRKRARLPVHAKEAMRDWLQQHWSNPVPSEEQKRRFSSELGIQKKQVENWFINERMRVWRPMMRKAAEQAKKGGNPRELEQLLQHCPEGNVYKTFVKQLKGARV